MTSRPTSTCTTCGCAVDATLLGGACPRCLLGDAMTGPEEAKAGNFDGHELLGEIARGGMGVVYRARQLEPERTVALKTLRATSLDSPEAIARFKHEAEVMVALDHAAILPVYHCGNADGIPFFTMKLVEGGTLADRLESYGGQWRAIAGLMARVCDGVRHAHERGVLHRDLKPGNILFDAAGEAYVSDFGIAKLADSQNASLTMTMSMIGTPHYFAPEVAAGGVKAASVSSDVWSLGVILYELLTGRKPFQGEAVTQVLRALENEEAPAPRQLRPNVPRDLEVIVLKALAREPARRYSSAQALAEDLRAWLEDRPITARAATAHERAWLWTRRNPWLAGTAALLVLAVFAAAGSLVWGFVRVKQENVRVVASEATARARLRDSLFHQARAGRVAREMGWRAMGLKALREAHAIRPGDDVRDEAVAHLAGFDLELGERRFDAEIFPARSMEFYAQRSGPSEISVRRMSDDSELFRLPTMPIRGTLNVEFDPRGQWLALSAGEEARVYSMDDRRELARWPGAILQASEDGEFLTAREKDRWVLRHTADWSVAAEVPRGGLVLYFQSRSQPGSQPLFAMRGTRSLNLMDWRTGAMLRPVEFADTPTSYDWLGDHLVANFRNGSGQAFDLRRGRSLMLPKLAHPGKFFGNSQSVFMLSSGTEAETELWHLPTGTGLVKGRGFVVREFGKDDRRFITRGTQPVQGLIVNPSCVRLLPERQMTVRLFASTKTMDLSPDGRLLLIHDQFKLAIHEVATGRLLAHQLQNSIYCAAFSPDGGKLWMAHGTGIKVFNLARRNSKLVLVPDREVPLPETGRVIDTLFVSSGAGVFVRMQNGNVFEWRMERDAWRRRPEIIGLPVNIPAISTLAVSRDERWIAGIRQGIPSVYEAGKMSVPHKLVPPQEPIQQAWLGRVSFSPDSRRLIFVDREHRWEAFDAPDWHPVASSGKPAAAAGSSVINMSLEAAWSPDGSWFAVVCGDSRDIHLVETGTWRTMARLHGPLEISVSCLSVAADGSHLVVQRRDGPVEIWDLRKLEEEMRALGMELRLPPAITPPPSPSELAGPFDELVLPPLIIQGAQRAR